MKDRKFPSRFRGSSGREDVNQLGGGSARDGHYERRRQRGVEE